MLTVSPALDIVQARINLESKDPSLTEALATFRRYHQFPTAFVYKNLKFVKFGTRSLDAERKRFERVINNAMSDNEDGFYTREFEYINHGATYKGFSISIDNDDIISDNKYVVTLSDDPIGTPVKATANNAAEQFALRINAAIAKVDEMSTKVPDWAKQPITLMGVKLNPVIELDSDGDIVVSTRNWSTSSIAVQLHYVVGKPNIAISVTAKPRGATSNRTFDFKIPASFAESGQLPAKLRELCNAKNIFQSTAQGMGATVVVDVGSVKQTFEVKDAVAFKKHLLQYLKGN